MINLIYEKYLADQTNIQEDSDSGKRIGIIITVSVVIGGLGLAAIITRCCKILSPKKFIIYLF